MQNIQHSQRGFVLFSALILLVTLTLVAVTYAYRNTLDEQMASNQRDSVAAMVVAESGLEAGWSWIRKKHDGMTVWHSDFEKISDAEFVPLKDYVDEGDGNTSLDNVTVMRAKDEDDNMVIVMNSIGRFRGAERELEVVMEMKDSDSNSAHYAILTSDDIDKMSGTITVDGKNAHVHSNSDLITAGDPVTIGGNASASGRVVQDGGTLRVNGETQNGADTVEIPVIDPRMFKQDATVVLTSNCKYEDANGNRLNISALKSQWECSSGDWKFSDQPKNGYEAFYYVEGSVEISGGPQNTWYASFAVEGSMKVSGSGINFRPWGSHPDNSTGDRTADQILFLAANDIELSGEDDSDSWGIIATHQELKVNGNWTLMGTMIAENGASKLDWKIKGDSITDKNEFSGNWTLMSDGSPIFEQDVSQALAVTAWRELVPAPAGS